MKKKRLLWVCLVFLLNSSMYAQKPPLPGTREKSAKPYLFAELPEQFVCNEATLRQLIAAKVNEQINAQLSGGFLIKARIVEKNQQRGGITSVNVRLENYHNALFNISVQLTPGNVVRWQGRIFRPGYTDALILYREKEKYFFKKQSLSLLMPD